MRSKSNKTNQKFEFLRFLHLSDFHFSDINFQDGISIDKEKGYQSPHISILDEVYEIIDDVDYILISGDFTTKSEKFDECLSFISDKFSQHNIEIYSVFGNHDLDRRYGDKKFDRLLKIAENYSNIYFGGFEISEQKQLTTSNLLDPDLSLLLVNTCKRCSDNPIIPSKLMECIKKPILDQYSEKIANELCDKIKVEIEESTLIDDISFEEEDYETLKDSLTNLGPLVCLSHYNLVSFKGVDQLKSFFSDQGKIRDLFVKHKDSVVYLSGHTHTQECTVIENPEDASNKLICITSPPFFKLDYSSLNGFNVVDIILRMDSSNIYKPIGCNIQKIGYERKDKEKKQTIEKITECQKIRFSKSLKNIEFTNDEKKVITTLKNLIKKTGEEVRFYRILESLNISGEQKFTSAYLHELLMYLWWIGIIDEYSAMKRKNEFEVKPTDNVGVVLCMPVTN